MPVHKLQHFFNFLAAYEYVNIEHNKTHRYTADDFIISPFLIYMQCRQEAEVASINLFLLPT
jgi:hypothetical protein